MERIIHEILEVIHSLSHRDVPVVIAIDGRCAAGKTTLAEKIQKR